MYYPKETYPAPRPLSNDGGRGENPSGGKKKIEEELSVGVTDETVTDAGFRR